MAVIATGMLLAWFGVVSMTLVGWVSVSFYAVLTIATWRTNPLFKPGRTMDFIMALLGAATTSASSIVRMATTIGGAPVGVNVDRRRRLAPASGFTWWPSSSAGGAGRFSGCGRAA